MNTAQLIAYLLCALCTSSAPFAADPPGSLPGIPDGTFEQDRDSDNWPDGWAKPEQGASWQAEQDNHFLRLHAAAPDTMIMLYQELPLPADAAAIRLTWKQRVTSLKRGSNSWFDARIMLEFMDADRQAVKPTPPAAATGRDTDGWVQRELEFLVPAEARTLKFMPSLFRVQTGQFDLDDLRFELTDPQPIAERLAEQQRLRTEKQERDAAARRAKAARTLLAQENLLTNGSFELHKKQSDWPDDWGRLKEGGSWQEEGSSHFLRMQSTSPGSMILLYREVDLPPDTKAVELTWKQRITGLKRGTSPWFDARIMLEFKGIDGKVLAQKPAAPNTSRDTDGWVERRSAFLVPDEALSLVLMPTLFQTAAGTMDLDDLQLRPVDPAPLLAAAELRRKEIAARHVPVEEPNRENWPAPLKVVGNRLHDPQGNEVWLQGVNAGGLETLPADLQVIKSVVVAIDEWKANCVRVPMNEAFWFGRSDWQSDAGQEYRQIIDRIVNLAANRGAYVVIDLHRFHAPRAEHAEFWKDCATRYRNHPAVLFDLFNEPHGIDWQVWKHGGQVSKPTADEPQAGFESIGMQKLVDAVRAVEANNVVIAGGLFWCNDLSGIAEGYALEDPQGNGVMYSWHTYNWHRNWEQNVLATAARHPVFVGEMGADEKKMDFIPAADQESPYTWVPDMLGFVQQHRLNWTGWCLHPKATPVMISDWSYTPTPYWGEFARRALSGEKFPLQKTR